jgi:hypothetical protein
MLNCLRYERLAIRAAEARPVSWPALYSSDSSELTTRKYFRTTIEHCEALHAIGPLAPALLVTAARSITVR